MTITEHQLRDLLDQRFHGVLLTGKHQENSQACAMELLSVAKGIPWTDNPEAVRSFDLRSINDVRVDGVVRAQHLLPLLAAYADSMDWPVEQQARVVTRIILLTINRLISQLPQLPSAVAQKCRDAATLTEVIRAAEDTAKAAEDTSSARAAEAVRAAARAAEDADWAASSARAAEATAWAAMVAAGDAARQNVFIDICALWMEAVTNES